MNLKELLKIYKEGKLFADTEIEITEEALASILLADNIKQNPSLAPKLIKLIKNNNIKCSAEIQTCSIYMAYKLGFINKETINSLIEALFHSNIHFGEKTKEVLIESVTEIDNNNLKKEIYSFLANSSILEFDALEADEKFIAKILKDFHKFPSEIETIIFKSNTESLENMSPEEKETIVKIIADIIEKLKILSNFYSYPKLKRLIKKIPHDYFNLFLEKIRKIKLPSPAPSLDCEVILYLAGLGNIQNKNKDEYTKLTEIIKKLDKNSFWNLFQILNTDTVESTVFLNNLAITENKKAFKKLMHLYLKSNKEIFKDPEPLITIDEELINELENNEIINLIKWSTFKKNPIRFKFTKNSFNALKEKIVVAILSEEVNPMLLKDFNNTHQNFLAK